MGGASRASPASFSYLQALGNARSVSRGDPAGQEQRSVPIIKLPDFNAHLLRMKSHVEAMRALITLRCLHDRGELRRPIPEEKAK
jgi:alkylation response protein AidB-like acyl-CoA dehydrogenase